MKYNEKKIIFIFFVLINMSGSRGHEYFIYAIPTQIPGIPTKFIIYKNN